MDERLTFAGPSSPSGGPSSSKAGGGGSGGSWEAAAAKEWAALEGWAAEAAGDVPGLLLGPRPTHWQRDGAKALLSATLHPLGTFTAMQHLIKYSQPEGELSAAGRAGLERKLWTGLTTRLRDAILKSVRKRRGPKAQLGKRKTAATAQEPDTHENAYKSSATARIKILTLKKYLSRGLDICQVRIRSCCCCSLFVATILTLAYMVVFYGVSVGLGAWGLAKTVTEAADPSYPTHYRTCLDEVVRGDSYKRTYDDLGNQIVVRDVSNTPYYCSLGLYFEELKFHELSRFPVLVVDIVLFSLILLALLLFIVGMVVRFQWILLPLVVLFGLDILRGLISTIFIFVLSYGSLIRIAVGIFFLGVQIFHISLLLVLVAQFQWLHDLLRGKLEPAAEKWVAHHNAAVYPTLPAHYPASPSARRHDGYYQTQAPPQQMQHQASYSTYDPRYH